MQIQLNNKSTIDKIFFTFAHQKIDSLTCILNFVITIWSSIIEIYLGHKELPYIIHFTINFNFGIYNFIFHSNKKKVVQLNDKIHNFTLAYTFGIIGNLSWYQSMKTWVQTLSPSHSYHQLTISHALSPN